MANLIRSAKSGNDWTLNDLDSYHISLNQIDPLMFFGMPDLPQPLVDQELLSNINAGAMQQDCHAVLITYLDVTMITQKGETAVDNFVVELFRVLGYVRRERIARTRADLSLLICGENRHTKTDVCIIDRSQNDILLLVQEDKKLELNEPANARAQLVAEAVAAFNENNAQREVAGLHPLVMPGIVMVGTSPAFFKIPVTQTLSTHIRHGTYPEEETRVTYCYPPISRPSHRRTEGMKPLDNRRQILRCYEAFKVIVGI
ncbi:hypothetical protein BS47DRAFT_1288244 [Hydnum rufescens UP504]|uniref:Uncharacterized protein n=1 Tax=Hydnum rufescens UP504 TaxID=1448309 RepID=A0A9P6B833_9AGAM|nr:hypothetical protein BS47DRAFT_1288244 [Hydnum rufescens UP504]